MSIISLKDIVMNVFLITLLSFFAYLLAKEFFSLNFPGFEEKILFVALILGIFLAILHLSSRH